MPGMWTRQVLNYFSARLNGVLTGNNEIQTKSGFGRVNRRAPPPSANGVPAGFAAQSRDLRHVGFDGEEGEAHLGLQHPLARLPPV